MTLGKYSSTTLNTLTTSALALYHAKHRGQVGYITALKYQKGGRNVNVVGEPPTPVARGDTRGD